MATSSGKIFIAVTASDVLTSSPDKGVNTRAFQSKVNLYNGVADGKIDLTHASVSTIAPAGADLIDLTAVDDGFGTSVNFAQVDMLVIENTGDEDLVVGGAVTTPWSAPFGAAVDTLVVPSGQYIILANLTGWTVDGTHKILSMASTSGTDYKIIILGRSS